MVDFGRLLQKQKDQKMMAEIIVDEIISEFRDRSWWDSDEQEQEFRDKYIQKILKVCRI